MRFKLERGEEPAMFVIAFVCLTALLVAILAVPSVSGSQLWAALRELCFGPTQAVANVRPGSAAPVVFDPTLLERGRTVSRQVCTSCHGGVGSHAAFAPRLEGLRAGYLHKQLNDYATGRRRWPVMQAIAGALTPEDRKAAAVYYASKSVPPGSVTSVLDLHTDDLVHDGDASRGLPACAACHGKNGLGIERQAPRLAGRPAADLAHALRAFRDGSRANDTGRPMRNVASRLSDREIDALARYWASVEAASSGEGS